MLRSLTLENFKPFGAPQTIRLAPVTLIYGPNSAGKTSILESILLAKQVLEKSDPVDRRLPIWGPHVDLRSLFSVVFGHDVARAISVGIEYDLRELDEDGEGDWRRTDRVPPAARLCDNNGDVRALSFTWSLCFERSDVKRGLESACLDSFSLAVRDGNGSSPIVFRNHTASRYPTFRTVGLDPPESLFLLADQQSVAELERLAGPVRGMGAEETQSLLQELRSGTVTFESTFSSFPDSLDGYHIDHGHYLSPFFDRLRREAAIVAASIAHPWSKLGTREDLSRLDLRASDTDGLRNKINRLVGRLGVSYTAELHSQFHPAHGRSLGLVLRDTRTDTAVGASDVGSGIGYLVPLLLLASEQRGRTVLLQEPEAHAHPKLQANIGDFLLETAGLITEHKPSARNQWIVETHSECIVLRILRRVREGIVDPTDISVVYVDPAGEGGSRVLPLRIDADGEFRDEWPDGFFEESYRELFAH